MRKLSITSRIIIWYTIFLVVIALAFVFTISLAENNRAKASIKNQLIETVAEASEDIVQSGEDFIIEKGLDYRDGGAYISVYSGDGHMLEGVKPRELQNLPNLRDRNLSEVEDNNGNSWYVYDSIFEVGEKYVWVRGITENYAASMLFSDMIKLILMALPTLIILAAIGGFVITKRSFRPLRDVINTVNQITVDGDLSRRVKEPKTNDVISEVAGAFNGMFDSLEKVFEEEKQFTSDVSHELRTPISVISTQSEYALEDEEYREKALNIINSESRRMSQLVNRLLVLARSDAGRLTLEKETIDFSDMCSTVAEQQALVAAEKGITIKSEIEDKVKIEGDEAMLIRIILNLVDNAMKYGCTNGGEIDISLKTENEGSGKMAVCTVSDKGPGISKEDQEKIWNRFYRGDESRNDKNSNGLGLSMVKSLTEAHGGTVHVESSKGNGSIFTVKFPMT